MKKGTKVKVIVSNYLGDPKELMGKVGFIVKSGGNSQTVLVRFPGWTGGHDGEKNNPRLHNRWYFDRDALRVIKRKKVSKRKKTA